MIPVVTREQARAFDRACIDVHHVPSLLLMENAGRGVVDAIATAWPKEALGSANIVVVAGTGNNGGDGFVIARHLLTRGAAVVVFVVGGIDRIQGDARVCLDALVGLGVAPRDIAGDVTELRTAITGATFVVDAVFGTGLSRPVVGTEATVLEALQHATGPIIAVDIPSGLDADTGVPLSIAVRADLTVTFAAHKQGLLTPAGAAYVGRVVVADIGVPQSVALRTGHAAGLVERQDVARLLGPRAKGAHKGGAGHVVVFAGSAGHVGAAAMCAQAALRAGAGLVTIATWPEAADALDMRVVEVMTARLSRDALAASVDDALARAKVVVMGPGFGKDEAARSVVRYILSRWEGPSVVDADALAMFPDEAEVFASSKGAAVLTPHPGELGVLLGSSAKDIEADRFSALAEAVERARSVTVLKGAHTLVGAPDERPVVNATGNAALATAGSGDVLAGTIAAFACSLDPFEAAFAGVHVHGLAGDAWAAAHGDRGLLAHEIAEAVPSVLHALVAEGRVSSGR